MQDLPMYGSMFLVGAALALAGVVGTVMPRGSRGVALLALLAGAGVGIAGLALGSAATVAAADADAWWRVFLAASVGGFATVVLVLAFAWGRASRQPVRSHA
jgi:ABC-type Fe3+-siderophore transport system permease subunit